MPSYTPEQIEQAKAYFKGIGTGETRPHFDSIIYANKYGQILLAVLEAAQKERDALAAYAAKLEKTGDAVRHYKPDNNPLQAEVDIEDLFDAWDAARKAKP